MPTPAPQPVPPEMHTVTPHLWFKGNCLDAVRFYQAAFGACVLAPPVMGPNGKDVMHAMIQIGDSPIMMADAWPGAVEQGPEESATAGLWLYVSDCDKLYAQAIQAGCEDLIPMMDAFWGDRMGKVKDPFGHCWSIATRQWELTREELAEREKEWLRSLEQTR